MAATAPKVRDVPPLIALGLLVLAGAVLFPIVHRTPLYPTALPPFAVDGRALVAEHRADLRRERPSAVAEVLSAWNSLNRAQEHGEPPQQRATAQARFADTLFEATNGAPEQNLAVRAVAAQQFLDRLSRPGDAGTMRAARHGLAGPDADPTLTDAHRLAWFTMRWQRLALPTPEHGMVEPLRDTLLRVSPAVQRAFASWMIAVPCAQIVDLSQASPQECADRRREMIEIAARADPQYPRDEALAATDMMLAVALHHPTPEMMAAREGHSLGTENEDAQRALQRALGVYAGRAQTTHERKWERLTLAVLQELAE